MTETFIINNKICRINQASHNGTSLAFSIRAVFGFFIQKVFYSQSFGIFFHFWNKLFSVFIKNTKQNILRNTKVFYQPYILKKQTHSLFSVFYNFFQMKVFYCLLVVFYMAFILKMSTQHRRCQCRFSTPGRRNNQKLISFLKRNIFIPDFRLFDISGSEIFRKMFSNTKLVIHYKIIQCIFIFLV